MGVTVYNLFYCELSRHMEVKLLSKSYSSTRGIIPDICSECNGLVVDFYCK